MECSRRTTESRYVDRQRFAERCSQWKIHQADARCPLLFRFADAFTRPPMIPSCSFLCTGEPVSNELPAPNSRLQKTLRYPGRYPLGILRTVLTTENGIFIQSKRPPCLFTCYSVFGVSATAQIFRSTTPRGLDPVQAQRVGKSEVWLEEGEKGHVLGARCARES